MMYKWRILSKQGRESLKDDPRLYRSNEVATPDILLFLLYKKLKNMFWCFKKEDNIRKNDWRMRYNHF